MKTGFRVPWTISTLHAAYLAGETSPPDAIQDLLERIALWPDNHDWICLRSEPELMAEARLAESRLRQPGALARYPLLGVPFAVKDNIDVDGLPTTAACPAFAYRPTRNAAAVERLIRAGAIVIGKTNLDQFATGLVGIRTPYGAVSNPFHPDYIAGGSSSGSAAATARGHAVFALGTDTAGSGRIPAGACNVVGLKPSGGLISNEGVVPACATLDCVSIFAHVVEDAWDVLSVMADPEQGLSTPVPRFPKPLGPSSGTLRLGLPDATEFFGDHLAAGAWQASLQLLLSSDAISGETFAFAPFKEVAGLLYEGPWIAERQAALNDFISLHDARMDPTVRAIVSRAEGLSAVDAFQGFYRLAKLKKECHEVFERFDALVVPTSPALYTIAQVRSDPIELNSRLGYYTNFVNLLGLAAVALPGAFRSDDLPAGITLIGPPGSDQRLAALAMRLQSRLHTRLGTGTQPPPVGRVDPSPLPTDETRMTLAVVGAHLRGLPLNHQLLERRARFVTEACTAPQYRLFALADTHPMKPGLVRCAARGASIVVELWTLPLSELGLLMQQIPAPLGVGSIRLADGCVVQGFLCESAATHDARDISEFGGWRAYLLSLSATQESRPT